jgi:hypothetical protein
LQQRRIPAQGNGRRMTVLRDELLAEWSAVMDDAEGSGTYTLSDSSKQFERMVKVGWTISSTPSL